MSKKAHNPIDEACVASEKLATIKAKNEFKLWEQWKQNPGPDTVHPLMQHFESVINSKIRQWKAPNVNEDAFRGDLKINAIKAFETYDPNRGAALRTHLENHLIKSLRYNTKQQNAMYIPEGKSGYIGKIDSAVNELTEETGIEPTHGQIATLLNERLNPRRPLTATKVKQIQDARVRDVLSSNLETDPSPFAISRDREIVSLLRPALPADHQAVFDYLFGLNGKQKIDSTNELARVLGKSASQISRIRTSILNKFDSYR